LTIIIAFATDQAGAESIITTLIEEAIRGSFEDR